MGKFKNTLQNNQAPAVKINMRTSIVKKKRKKGKKSLSNIHNNNLKKQNVSNKIIKNTFINMQNNKKKSSKSNFKNKLGVKDTEELYIPTKYSKDNKKLEVFKKVQIKKRNKKQKQSSNLNHVNKDVTMVDNARKKNKKLQMPAKKSTKAEAQQIKPDEVLKLNKHKINIKQLEEMLASKSKSKQKVTQLTLRDRMMTQLRASRFRFINELLYTNNSSLSKRYFKEDPDSFLAYHAGYKQQLEQWAVNPLDVIISSIKKLPVDNVIADFGCGEARLATSVPHTVHSFDFIALNNKVKACDMAHTPLLMNSVHVVVFCLSLMGSNLNDYIMEANRVLKINGILKIAEVESRFENVNDFIKLLRGYGFKNTWKDLSHNLFYFMDFKKQEDITMKRKNLSPITLKSCLYKKR
ncbi:ribosomal RNA-processing protein 8 isoform X2 [Monomorium pharaonis]|uniref:ribosomal RNA-processing protein 8 isoform X2 n=1 Tax=Monomorium pharaonis TaxID=307658 RepID=UPI00102E1A87|nr:ribosomal RNA-processing protein 8 isoform X2 [Monomorium pharaonis]